MIPLSASRVAEIASGQVVAGDPTSVATEVKIDSRRVGHGDCFVAILGPRDDGHRYLQPSIASGASVLVIERPEVAPHLVGLDSTGVVLVADTTRALQDLARHVLAEIRPTVVAITGSVGKTTTKTLTHELLRGTRPTHATPGNFNNQWGLPLSLLGLEPHHAWMVAELGMSAAGEIAALAALAQPQLGVITNVAPVHMENFASVEGVAAAKRELAEGLEATGTLVVNADDPRTNRIGEESRERLARVLTFGRAPDADVRAAAVSSQGHGWQLDLVLPDRSVQEVGLPLPGKHSIANFLAAASAAWAMGVDPSEIARRAAGLRLPSMRGEIHQTPSGILVLDDSYNASPAAMISAIDALVQLPGDGRLVLAAGDMRELGTWSEEAHREVGLHAAQTGYDLIYTVGAMARDIGLGARAGGLGAEQIRSFTTADEAADAVATDLRPGDRLLVKGSRAVGMEAVTRALVGAASSGGA